MRTIDRRAFLARTAAGAVGTSMLLVGCDPQAPAPAVQQNDRAEADPFDPQDWTSVRAQFDLQADAIQLAAFVLASHPRPVRDAIERYRIALDRDPYGYVGVNEVPLEDETRAIAARYMGVTPQEIALTDSTTMGLALIYNGLKLNPGDEILATTHDFYSTHESIRLRHEREGIPFRRVELFSDPTRITADEVIDSVKREIRPNTRALAVTWVHSSTGVKLPVRSIAEALTDINAKRDEEEKVLLCVDGVHGFGNQDESPFDLGCDLFASGTHKWLFGPRGTGIVWGKFDSWSRIVPTIPTFAPAGIGGWLEGSGPMDRTPGPLQTPGGFHSFEHRWALTEAFQFHLDIGRDRVAARTRGLAQRLKEGLSEINSVRLITPMDPELSAGIVCFEVEGRQPPEVVSALQRARNIRASVTPYAESYVRMGPSIVTSEDDIEETVLVMRALA